MEIIEGLRTKRTIRRFDQNKPVPEHIIRDILLAQQYSSSAANRQPLRYVVIQSAAMLDQVFPLTRWAAALPVELGTPKEGERPTLYVVVLHEQATNTKLIDIDAGIAMSNMTLAAWNHGVGSCIIHSVVRDSLHSLLGLNEATVVHGVIAFGYPIHQSSVVLVNQEEKLAYYLDDQKDYCVPKRLIEDVVTFR